MFNRHACNKTCKRIVFPAAAVWWFVFLAVAVPGNAPALLYRTPVGTLKDNCVVFHDGAFYLLAMSRREEKPRDQDQWRHVWLAPQRTGRIY